LNNQVKGFSDKLPRIDFVYFKIWEEKRYHCYMEAKRLKETDASLKKAYINNGIDRFTSGRYPLGCMLGYLVEGDTGRTVNGINSLLIKDSRNSEILHHESHQLINSYYESTHLNMGTLKHFIFDFTNPSSN
jgi:hypothetical protein